jgi:hypothetical protein
VKEPRRLYPHVFGAFDFPAGPPGLFSRFAQSPLSRMPVGRTIDSVCLVRADTLVGFRIPVCESQIVKEQSNNPTIGQPGVVVNLGLSRLELISSMFAK